jgi:hypothetical protein
MRHEWSSTRRRNSRFALFLFLLTIRSAIAAGSFTIAVVPSSSTVTQGNSASYSVTVYSQNGFNSGVLLEVLNLPAGFVASGTGFSPGPTVTPPANGSITSTLTIGTNGTTATGLASMTVRASSSGQTTQTQSISLTVNPGTFRIY